MSTNDNSTQCEKLRTLVQDCLAKHLYESAVFYADKLVARSNGDLPDVYLLAQAYYVSRQYRRALMLLKPEVVLANIQFRYIAAKCLYECREYDECLALLGDGEAEDDFASSPQEDGCTEPGELSWYAAACLLRGKVYEAMDNRPRAVRWYKAALKADPHCYEAFIPLVENHMLANKEEVAFIESLPYKDEDRWLKLMYRCKCDQYEQQELMDHYLTELEQPVNAGLGSSAPDQDLQVRQEGPSQRQDALPSTGLIRPHGDLANTRGPDGEASSSRAGGGLGDNLDVMTCRAEWLYHRGDYEQCYQLSGEVLMRDAYALKCFPVHLASAVQLKKKNELFLRAHKLVDEYPDRAVSWFAVGCYYMCTQQYDSARRYFGKATSLEPTFAPAWIGFGHAFAALDESDQAMAAYRTCSRLFPGLHVSLLGMGMEYQRMNSLDLAERMFHQAFRICDRDPLVHHELGVLAYKKLEYREAERHFRQAIQLVPGRMTAAWEPTLVNLAHTLRKEQRYKEAIELYEQALALNPGQPGTYGALGFTHHLLGDCRAAVEQYHKALGLRPDDPFTTEMLNIALEEECERIAGSIGDLTHADMAM